MTTRGERCSVCHGQAGPGCVSIGCPYPFDEEAWLPPGMDAHLTMIRAYASVISSDNWCEMRTRMRIEFDALEAIVDGVSEDGK